LTVGRRPEGLRPRPVSLVRVHPISFAGLAAAGGSGPDATAPRGPCEDAATSSQQARSPDGGDPVWVVRSKAPAGPADGERARAARHRPQDLQQMTRPTPLRPSFRALSVMAAGLAGLGAVSVAAPEPASASVEPALSIVAQAPDRIHVSQLGSDGNPGTAAAPVRTVERAL